MNLVEYTRPMESAADRGATVDEARWIADEVRALGYEYEWHADVLLMLFGERSAVAIAKVLEEAGR